MDSEQSDSQNHVENDQNFHPKKEDLSLTKEEVVKEEQKAEPTHHHEEQKHEPAHSNTRKMSVPDWLNAMKWSTNPFIFNIMPSLFVGYRSQTERIMMALEEKHKLMLILGPTGSGKTTLLKWLSLRLRNYDVLYIGKPPKMAEDFVEIFNSKYKKHWYAFWDAKPKTIYDIPDFLNKKLHRKSLVLLIDEIHEANTDILEWLRVLNDQVENMSIVLSGLPSFDEQLRNNLETFMKRATAKIELLSLTKEETRELIEKRIQNVGGTGREFDHVYERIYEYTAGFPREILRVCDQLVNSAILNGRTRIEFDIHEQRQEMIELPKTHSLLDKMTAMQKEILEMLSKKPMTPGQIANSLDLTKYKSRQHAVRSVNNVVTALQNLGYLERRREEKAFVYSLSPKLSTLFVKS
ncbi:MAG: ATPase, T2SS/T4P/T4SS family [Candidatus Aenigmarchaeota archaeon]|nr:ATPase, T2SS/T4P/T4SS family [Candidatus Aenigmarchaeota archaeon]